MERTDYPGLLQKVQPGQAVDILSDRVAQVKRLNTSIADWLAERCRLEEQYAAGLRRLARKPIDDMDLGIFSVPWNALTESMGSLADSHQSLSTKIEVDVERPLREFATTNRDMQAMTTIQGNLSSMAKDIEKAQGKTEKLQGKGERADANKVANASSDLDTAKVQWDSQAPYIFETLQALDETRINTLRDHLTQYVTLEVDQMEKNRVAVESSLNVLLNVETADEIKTFALKAAQARRGSASRPNRESRFNIPGVPTPSRGASATGPSGLTPIQSIPDEASQAPGGAPEPAKKTGFKGLRRLGTVMSKRSSKMPQQLPSTSESPERKPKPSPFGALRRNKSSYTEALEPPQESSSSPRPRSPLRVGSEVLEPPVNRYESASPSQASPRLDPVPRTNGIGSATSPTAPSFAPSFTPSFATASHQGDLAGMAPPKPSQPQAPAFPTATEPQRDSEGFSVPPQYLDPISQAQADADFAGERQEPQFNVNIRNAPIQEEGGEAALANVAGKLQAPPHNARRLGTVRGRRDARHSTIVSSYGQPGDSESLSIATPPIASRSAEHIPLATSSRSVEPPVASPPPALVQSPSGAFNPTGPSAAVFSPFSSVGSPTSPQHSTAPPLASEPTGDNQSIRSGRSHQSTASQGARHPELHEQGLNSSIVETVSARFEHGQIVSSSLVGEIALAYNPLNFSTSLGQETIRLENFASLDKVAPNPAFISQASREGEYAVNLANITRTQIAFKYQLRSDDPTTHAPFLLAPAFRIEPNQASVIVSYSLHPSFSLQAESITFSNVTIAFTLEGAKASSCQSRPVGTFARDKNLIFWQLGDITVRPGGAPEKLLARFATESEATGGHIEGRWEVVGENVNGVGSKLAVSVHGADPFADETTPATNWRTVPTVRKLASGSYVAKS